MSKRLENKNIVVTAAGQGIGIVHPIDGGMSI